MKNCVIRFKDGFAGTAAVEDTSIADEDATLEIDTIADLSGGITILPIGVRFSVADMSPSVVYTITAVNSNEQQTVDLDTPSSGHFHLIFDGQTVAGDQAYDASAADVKTSLETLSNIAVGDVVVTGSAGGPYIVEFQGDYLATDVALMTIDKTALVDDGAAAVTLLHAGATTWELTFSPVLDGANLPVNGKVITFLPQQLDIKVGDGNITYTENDEYEYDLDRGLLDTVRSGNQVPMDITLDFVYEYITTGTSEEISPMDALKKIGGASEWVSSSNNPCEPYAIDVEVVHTPICTTQAIETTLFSDFRSESREVDMGEASVSVSGRCNVTQPGMSRTDQ